MALLLQCLRDARTMSGDLDLLPPPGGGRPFDAGRVARDIHRHGSLPLAVNPTPLVAGSLREIPEECHWSLQVLDTNRKGAA